MYSPLVGGSTKLSVSGRLGECAADQQAYSLLAAIASPFCIWGLEREASGYASQSSRRDKTRLMLCLASATASSRRGAKVCKIDREKSGKSARVG